MKEKLKKNFKKYEDLLVYLGGSMSIILVEIVVWSIKIDNILNNLDEEVITTIRHIITGAITLSLLILLGMHFIKKGGD